MKGRRKYEQCWHVAQETHVHADMTSPVRPIWHQQDCGLELSNELPWLLIHDRVGVQQPMTQAFYNSQPAAASFPRAGSLQFSKCEGESRESSVNFFKHRPWCLHIKPVWGSTIRQWDAVQCRLQSVLAWCKRKGRLQQANTVFRQKLSHLHL